MSIPLVQNNEKDSINTSIIAIKRQIERINALLGLSNSEEIDTSVFATKEELEDAVTQVETDLAPVDEVTADNMQSVTSNAVNTALTTTSLKRGTFGVLGGAEQIPKSNINDAVTLLAKTGGICGGSIDVNTSSLGIGSGWYNLLYIPHRDGGESGDNDDYGVCLIFPMTSLTGAFYIVHRIGGTNYSAISNS